MGIRNKSIAFLIDELITTDIKCFMAQDKISDSNLSPDEQLTAAKAAQNLNRRRNQLMIAIDEILGESDITVTGKTY